MSNRHLAIMGMVGAIALSTPALGAVQYTYEVYDRNPLKELLVVFSICGALLFLALWVLNSVSASGSSGDDCNCPDCTGAQYEREAELMREITRHQDAHTALMRSEINHTRTYGEYRERPDIAEHEQTLREMRSRLC